MGTLHEVLEPKGWRAERGSAKRRVNLKTFA